MNPTDMKPEHQTALRHAFLCHARTVSVRIRPELIEECDRLRGTSFGESRSPVEMLVDAASGKTRADLETLVDFVDETVVKRAPEDAIKYLWRTFVEKVGDIGQRTKEGES